MLCKEDMKETREGEKIGKERKNQRKKRASLDEEEIGETKKMRGY